MKKINLGSSKLSVPAIAVGCMRINAMDEDSHIKRTIYIDYPFILKNM